MSRARRCGTWLAGTLPRLGGRIAGAGAVAVLVTGMQTPAALAAVGSGAVGPTREPVSDGPVGRDVGTFRVDVSRFPQIGVVVTVPGPVQGLQRSDFRVLSGREARCPASAGCRRTISRSCWPRTPTARQPGCTHSGRRRPGSWPLPAGARTGMADPSGAALVASPLSMDPARSVTDIAKIWRRLRGRFPPPPALRPACPHSAAVPGSAGPWSWPSPETSPSAGRRPRGSGSNLPPAMPRSTSSTPRPAPPPATTPSLPAAAEAPSASAGPPIGRWPSARSPMTSTTYYLTFSSPAPCPATP